MKLRVGSSVVKDEVVAEILENGWNLIQPIGVFKYERKEYKIQDLKIYKKHTVPLFTQASLISEMKMRRIGRPLDWAKEFMSFSRPGIPTL